MGKALFFDKTAEELDRYYTRALRDGRYIQVFKGSFTKEDVTNYKAHYPLGEVKLTPTEAVVVIMPQLGSLTTFEKLYEFVLFYVRNEFPQDLQGHISVTKTGAKALQLAFLSKGVDIGLRVLDSKFATHWDMELEDEYTCTLKMTFSNTGIETLTIREESIYYILQTLGNLLNKNVKKLTAMLEK